VIAVVTKHESGPTRAHAARLLSKLHQRIVSPGALLTLITGFYLTMQLGPGAMDRGSILGMQAAGLLAGLVTLLLGLPTAIKRARVAVPDATGELPPIVARLSARQAVVSTIAGLLGLTALAFVYLG
jgi:hypothetical protein